ncbi:hypothetical protein CXG81DRAFT_3338, partial [Caulochytrium protostelioides]
MFADDVVLLAESRLDLQQACDHFTEWVVTNEMAVGISKCGVMTVGATSTPMDVPPLLLQGQVVPEVAIYKYLGIQITDTLSVAAMVADRAAKGATAYHALRPTLQSSTIPAALRVQLVKSVLLP